MFQVLKQLSSKTTNQIPLSPQEEDEQQEEQWNWSKRNAGLLTKWGRGGRWRSLEVPRTRSRRAMGLTSGSRGAADCAGRSEAPGARLEAGRELGGACLVLLSKSLHKENEVDK